MALGHYGPHVTYTGACRRREEPGGENVVVEAAPRSPADIANIRTKPAAQHHAAQTQQLSTAGNPHLGELCCNCRCARGDPFHFHRRFATTVCINCQLAVHQNAAGTNPIRPAVSGGHGRRGSFMGR